MSGHFHHKENGVLIPSSNYKDIPCVELEEFEVGDDGFIHHKRFKTLGEVDAELNAALESLGLRPDEYGMDVSSSAGASYADRDKALIPKHRWISCFALEGGSEGHYIHIEAIQSSESLEPGKRVPLFLGKTFQGMDFAYEVAKTCAKILGA